jgi:hypothetical protein
MWMTGSHFKLHEPTFARDTRGNIYPLTKGIAVRAIRTKDGRVVTTEQFPSAMSHVDLAIQYIRSLGLNWLESFRETFASQDMRGFLDIHGQFVRDDPDHAWLFTTETPDGI